MRKKPLHRASRRVEQQRRAERGGDRQRHADDHEVERIAERLPEQRGLQQARVIAETDEAQIAQVGQRVDVEIGQAEHEGGDDRQEERTRR